MLTSLINGSSDVLNSQHANKPIINVQEHVITESLLIDGCSHYQSSTWVSITRRWFHFKQLSKIQITVETWN